MGRVGIVVLVAALAGALASWIVGAVYYARSLRAAHAKDTSWLAVVVWPFATKRISSTGSTEAIVVNKALVALLVCITLSAATVSLSTNLNRVSP
jgi:cell division protein FtsL